MAITAKTTWASSIFSVFEKDSLVSTLVSALSKTELDDIDRLIEEEKKGLPMRQVVGSTKSAPMGMSAQEIAQAARDKLEREEKQLKRKIHQGELDSLAVALRAVASTRVMPDENEKNHLQKFLDNRNNDRLTNLILTVHFGRDFSKPHFVQVDQAQVLAENWSVDKTNALVEYLALLTVQERQNWNESYLKPGKKSGDAFAEIEKQTKEKLRQEMAETARRANEQEIQKHRVYVAAEAAKLAAQEAAELEEAILVEQRDSLGAGEW